VLLHTSGPIAINNGTALFNYAYKQKHTNLTIEARFDGDANYNAATGRLTDIVVEPAPIV